jgi:hypothetical protein
MIRPFACHHVYTKETRKAILSLYRRNTDGAKNYREFRSRFYWTNMGCTLGQWCGMTIGIEPDGYTHS